MMHTCQNTQQVTCGNCGQQWCESCDPAPSALCHVCHGRGWTTAPLNKVRSNGGRKAAWTKRLNQRLARV